MPKISALTSLAQADVVTTTDVLPIVDATAPATTKKVTVQAMVNAGLATLTTLPSGIVNASLNSITPAGGTLNITGATWQTGAAVTATAGLSSHFTLQSTETAAVGAGPSLMFAGRTGNSAPNYSFGLMRGVKNSAGVDDYTGRMDLLVTTSAGSNTTVQSWTPDGVSVTGSISATGGATISGATSITANVKVGANTAEVSYSSGQPLAAVTNANSRVDIVVRNVDSGSSAGAGLVINPYGNSWRMGAGSAARDSNRLRWEIDALGSPVEVMGLGASGGLDVTGNITAHLPVTSNSTHRGLKFGVTLYGEDYGGVTMQMGSGEVRYTAGYSGWGGFHTWYCNGVKAMELTSGGSTYNITGTYGTISDARLKRDVTDATGKLHKVLAMRIVNYYLKADPSNTKLLGMIAQELREISPGLVEETPDYADVIVTPARTNTVTKQRQVTAPQEVTRQEPRQVNGQWRLMPVTETVQVQQWQELPLFDSAGQPVMGTVDGQQVQKMHRVPLMESYTETVNVPAVIESRPTGTTTLSIKYSILVPMLIKALQEMHAEFDSRLKAIGA